MAEREKSGRFPDHRDYPSPRILPLPIATLMDGRHFAELKTGIR